MENHPFGIALYRPPSSSEVKPGIIGYFDEFGSWNTIADLADQDDLLQKSLSPAEELVKAPTDKKLNGAQRCRLALEQRSNPAPGIPITASAVYSYQIDEDVGSILLTSAPVSHERYCRTTPLKNWMKQNASVILNRWRDEVKENGIWIVTSTFSAQKYWYRSHIDEGWGEYTGEGDNRCVVFFGGLKFRFSQGFRKEDSNPVIEENKDYLRTKSSEPVDIRDMEANDDEEAEYIITVPDPENDGQEFKVDCQDFGDTNVPE
ncbi:hypothetical protein BJ912DRAFT_1080205 [Pholiota molesta]|nr:hypothetical protein BJ912DRAFT_1080205 [Pholiota molesta]